MILADTSIWIDHLRKRNPNLEALLNRGQILMHPFIVGELSLGSLRNRKSTLAAFESLLEIKVATQPEVRHLIESHFLFSKGIGLTDAHLLASCLLSPGTRLWTRDAALNKVASSLRIAADHC